MNTIFPHLPQTLYAGRGKRFAEASEFFPRACVSVRRRQQNGILEEYPSGGQKWKSDGTISGMLGG
jgi:hypothetical protein